MKESLPTGSVAKTVVEEGGSLGIPSTALASVPPTVTGTSSAKRSPMPSICKAPIDEVLLADLAGLANTDGGPSENEIECDSYRATAPAKVDVATVTKRIASKRMRQEQELYDAPRPEKSVKSSRITKARVAVPQRELEREFENQEQVRNSKSLSYIHTQRAGRRLMLVETHHQNESDRGPKR